MKVVESMKQKWNGQPEKKGNNNHKRATVIAMPIPS
jgi:hypothetical protein